MSAAHKLCSTKLNSIKCQVKSTVSIRLLKSHEKLPVFLKLSREDTLVSRDEGLVSREGGNLLLSSTVHLITLSSVILYIVFSLYRRTSKPGFIDDHYKISRIKL